MLVGLKFLLSGILHSRIFLTTFHFFPQQLSGGSMMVGYLEVTETGVTLYDSQKTALSRRVVDLDTVSFCGMTRYDPLV